MTEEKCQGVIFNSSVDETNLQLDEVGCLQLAGIWVVYIVRLAIRFTAVR